MNIANNKGMNIANNKGMNMKTIEDMSTEELLASLSNNECTNCKSKTLGVDIQSMTVTCPTVTIPAQKTAPIMQVTVTHRSYAHSIASPTKWQDVVDVNVTIGDGWGDQPPVQMYMDSNPMMQNLRTPNTSFTVQLTPSATGETVSICADTTCTTYVTTIYPANITCVSAPSPTSPSLSEIDINFTWQNAGGASASFTPAVSITGIGTIDLGAGLITLLPDDTYNAVKALTGLSLSPGTTYTVCPIPN
jgi:hypothetical protein